MKSLRPTFDYLRKDNMPELVKNNNGDWPKKFNGKEKPWTNTVSADSNVFHLQLMDIFNPSKIRDWLKKDNQHHNKKKE